MSNHITGHTGLLCLLGSPVAHSVSPEMHNEACSQLGLDYTYLAFDVPEEKMPQAVEGLRTMGARGWNITMPGKNIMCKLADKVSPASEISGACNTIVNDDGVPPPIKIVSTVRPVRFSRGAAFSEHCPASSSGMLSISRIS